MLSSLHQKTKNGTSQIAVPKKVETSSRGEEAKSTPIEKPKEIIKSNPATTWAVRLTRLGERESSLATHIYVKCIDKIGRVNNDWSCENLVRTFTAENGAWNHLRMSPKNKNGTRDHGLCQLNDHRHKFVHTEDFKDPHKQLDYCLEVWIDAKNKGKMPWYAHHRHDKKYTDRQNHNRRTARNSVEFY